MTAPNQTALAVASSNAMVPCRSMAEVLELGTMIERSGLLGCTETGQGAVIVLTCQSEGISLMQFHRTYHIIGKKPAMRADAMLAKFVERGGKYIIKERSATRAAATFIKGDNKLDAEFTFQMAVDSGIVYGDDNKKKPTSKMLNGHVLKDNWANYPMAMCWARLCSDTIRALDPGVCAGIYTPEEVQDFPDAPQQVAGTSRRIESAPADDPAPEVLPPEPPVDVTVCPFGPKKGTKWEDLNLVSLESIATKRGTLAAYGMTDQHHDAVEAEIGRRQQQPAKEG